MAAPHSWRTIVLLSVIAILLLRSASAAHPWPTLSAEEELELEEQLKIINKPAKTSFKTEFGDTIDCVDIYKQPAFDHPLLKDHKIRTKPKVIPEPGTSLPVELKTRPCPKGTVPIIRATKESLLLSKYLPRDASKYLGQTATPNVQDNNGYGYAVNMYDKGTVFGASGNLNAWSPIIPASHFSSASIGLANGFDEHGASNSLETGWLVYDLLYPPNLSRIYVYWTLDGYKTGCYNVLCPGFVQVSKVFPVGTVVNPVSEYNGRQYELQLKIYQDNSTGDWWVRLRNEAIGYWPKAIFTSMQKGASHVAWGGAVYNRDRGLWSPPMGSGHLPLEGFGKAAFVSQMKLANENEVFNDVAEGDLVRLANRPNCYDVIFGSTRDLGKYIFYGGPGGNGCNL